MWRFLLDRAGARRALSGDAQNALATRSWLGGCAGQRTASVNYSGADADVARGFLHEPHSVHCPLATGRAKAHTWDLLCDRRIRNGGTLIPELFLILFFQRGRHSRRNLRNLLFTVPLWGLDGTLVDLLYRNEAAWFGDVATLPVVAAEICVDQFGYNPPFCSAVWCADL